MKKQDLIITYIDTRQSPPVEKTQRYSSHGPYLRDMAKLAGLPACHIHEQTKTTVTIYPEQTIKDLFE